MSSDGDPYPFVDVSGRMERFGRLFAAGTGVEDMRDLPTPTSLVDVVREHVPPAMAADEDAPVFEAAAFVGEWLRAKTGATWIAEGPYEPHLQLTDESHAIVYLLPLVQVMRTAASAGYDGMAVMLGDILRDVSEPGHPAPLDRLRVEPDDEREAVVHWVRENADVRNATRAALWRRCSVCAVVGERELTLHRPAQDWEEEAATAASVLSSAPFDCACGGPPGSVTRFLTLRHADRSTRLGDIYVTGTHTRVGCWTIDRDRALPFDALALAQDEVAAKG